MTSLKHDFIYIQVHNTKTLFTKSNSQVHTCIDSYAHTYINSTLNTKAYLYIYIIPLTLVHTYTKHCSTQNTQSFVR